MADFSVDKHKWREFEQLVSKIYTQATPGATVKHNYFIKGKSGRRRQIDVSIESTQGLHTYRTVVECKRYARRVGIGDVEAFITKLRDVSADKGVMVSTVGFDEGAQAQARQYDVTLFSYREAQETDWRKAGSASIWVTFTTEEFRPEHMIAQLADGSVARVQPEDDFLVDRDQYRLPAVALAASMIKQHPFLAPTQEAIDKRGPGPMWIEGRISTSAGPLVLPRGEESPEVDRITIQGTNVVLAYSANPSFESGHVIEDALTGSQPYTEVTSLPFRVEAVTRLQKGRPVTMEEYHAKRGIRIYLPPEVDVDNTALRLTITVPNAGR